MAPSWINAQTCKVGSGCCLSRAAAALQSLCPGIYAYAYHIHTCRHSLPPSLPPSLPLSLSLSLPPSLTHKRASILTYHAFSPFCSKGQTAAQASIHTNLLNIACVHISCRCAGESFRPLRRSLWVARSRGTTDPRRDRAGAPVRGLHARASTPHANRRLVPVRCLSRLSCSYSASSCSHALCTPDRIAPGLFPRHEGTVDRWPC